MHNIEYLEFEEGVSRAQIRNEVLTFVGNSGDGYGTEKVTFNDSEVFENREKAHEWIENHDKDWYGGYAVKFYDYAAIKDTKKIETLKQRIAENDSKLREYTKAHSVRNFKAQYVSCPCCGSKLNREKLGSDKCPLCYTDLRAKSTLDKIQSYHRKNAELIEQIQKEKQKDQKNAKIKWLVKFEYHS